MNQTAQHDTLNNWLALEQPIVNALQQALAGNTPKVRILTAAQLANISETTAPSPAVHVLYGGYTPGDDQGTALLLQHKWITAVAVRHLGNLHSGKAARAAMGPLLAQVVRAMLTARLPGARSTVQLLTPPPAQYHAGWQLVPAAFGVQTVFHKLPQR